MVGSLAFTMAFLTASSMGAIGREHRAFAGGGSGWVECGPGGASGLFDFCALDPRSAWAVGTVEGRQIHVFKTGDGGETWEILPVEGVEVIGTMELPTKVGITALDDREAWLFGYRSMQDMFILRTRDGGRTWEEMCRQAMVKVPAKVVALDENDLWMLGVEVLQIPDFSQQRVRFFWNAFIERSTNGGRDWVRQYNDLLSEIISVRDYTLSWLHLFMDMDVVDRCTAWAAVYDKVLWTGNGGLSWEQRLEYHGGIFSVARICAEGPSEAWLAVRGDLMKTENGGLDWVTRFTAGQGRVFVDVEEADTDTVWALDAVLSTMHPFMPVPSISDTRVFRTNDGGSSWFQQDAPYPWQLAEIKAFNPCEAWMTGNPFYQWVFRTEDGGDARPDLLSADPVQGETGSEVTVRGCDFGVERGPSAVTFGDSAVEEYLYWSDREIRVRVPPCPVGKAEVRVTTPAGTSNPRDFEVLETLSARGVSPVKALQHTPLVELTVQGSGFSPGVSVRLEKEGTVIGAFAVRVASGTELTASFSLLGCGPGNYDLVVRSADGRESRLPASFTVDPVCGAGSGTALLLLGPALGALSLAGAGKKRRMYRRESP